MLSEPNLGLSGWLQVKSEEKEGKIGRESRNTERLASVWWGQVGRVGSGWEGGALGTVDLERRATNGHVT